MTSYCLRMSIGWMDFYIYLICWDSAAPTILSSLLSLSAVCCCQPNFSHHLRLYEIPDILLPSIFPRVLMAWELFLDLLTNTWPEKVYSFSCIFLLLFYLWYVLFLHPFHKKKPKIALKFQFSNCYLSLSICIHCLCSWTV